MATDDQAATARRLIRSVDSGVLSTQSRELPGYPFGSVTPYVTTHEGRLAIYISTLAQHTKNIDADPKLCLTVLEPGSGNRQALGRVSVVGDASRVPPASLDAVASRYFRFFPEAEAYAGTHDFSFYWIEVLRVRYIGGFGRIFWIEADAWQLPTPAWAAGEQGMIDHMNDDHADALERIAATPGTRLIAIDPEGAHLRCGETLRYVPFSAAAYDAAAVRDAMIHLAARAE